MASPPPNPDTRALPYGWVQQYNWEYRQWYYVNTREQPPRSSWEHPGSIPPPPGPPPPDRSYSRSPYGDQPPQQGYGGYGYQPTYGQPPPQGYYNGPQGGYGGGPPPYASQNRGLFGLGSHHAGSQQPVYTQAPSTKKGPGLGTALLAGGAGLVGGALLMDAIEDHDEHERQEGFDQGYQDGWDDNQGDFGGDGGW